MTAVSVVLVAAGYIAVPDFYEETDSRRLTTVSVWYFFVLVNAYYGGALTMFFSTSPTIPFETIVDVFRAHPDWTLLFQRGGEINFAVPALRDADYAEFYARVQADPEKHIYANAREGLERIRKGQTVLYIMGPVLQVRFVKV